MYPKASCQSVPLVPNVKAGDCVKAPKYGLDIGAATVSSVDARNGRVFVKFDGETEDKAIAFGEVMN